MRILKLALCTLLLLTATATPGAAEPLPEPSGCSTASDEIPAKLEQQPVIYVHGWTGNSPDLAKPVAALQQELGADFRVFKFDYAKLSTTWPVGNKSADCLAYYIQQASLAYGNRPALGIGHSMGGITLRSASGVLAAIGESARLGGIVTLATPHLGSPLGDTAAADALQNYVSFASIFKNPNQRIVLSGSSAATCLSDKMPCPRAPYLSGNQKIAMLGTQITLERRLFNMKYVLDDSRVRIFGDGIVPTKSALGYAQSGQGDPSPSQLLGGEILECTLSSSSAAKVLIKGNYLNPEEAFTVLKDLTVDESYSSGKFSLIQLPSILGSLASPCSHIALTEYPPIVKLASGYLKKMAQLANRTDQEKEDDRIWWLYEVGSPDQDGSGGRTDVQYGAGDFESQNSTAQLVGCGGDGPKRKEYPLQRRFSSLTAKVGHRLGSPPDLESKWTIEVDGKVVTEFNISGRQTHDLEVNLEGAETLAVIAVMTRDTGCVAAEPYAVLGTAQLLESFNNQSNQPSPSTSSSPDNSAESSTAKFGWPTTRNDSNPGFWTWYGAASAWGVVNSGPPTWVACASTGACVSGNETEVVISATKSSGRYVVAEFVATEPAKQKLTSLGATEQELEELLRPG